MTNLSNSHDGIAFTIIDVGTNTKDEIKIVNKSWRVGSNSDKRTQSQSSFGTLSGHPTTKPCDETLANKLVQVVITYSSDNQICLYRNGVQCYCYKKGSIITYKKSTTKLMFGSKDFPFQGRIAEARLYNVALSDQQVTESYSRWIETANTLVSCARENVDMPGFDIKKISQVLSPADCQKQCQVCHETKKHQYFVVFFQLF